MTKEHNLWGESAEGLKSWLLTTQVWAPLSLSGIVELPYTLFTCLLYTSDAADDLLCVDLGGRRIIKKK